MQTVFITLVGPVRRVDLKLPAELPIVELLPKVMELFGPRLVHPQAMFSSWYLALPGNGGPLPSTRSLLDAGIVDGAVLFLQNGAVPAARQQQAAASAFRPQAIQPSANTGGIGVKWNLPNG